MRARGTIGGSIANNDPAADYPARLLALGAPSSPTKREIAADDFFTGMFETALNDGELITSVSFPVADKAALRQVRQPGLALCHGRRVRGAGGGGVRVR